ncbi:TPA: TraX family protein [Haemophilus influenzae]
MATAFLSEISFTLFEPNYDRLNVLFQFLSVIGVIWVYKNRQDLNSWVMFFGLGFFIILSALSDYGLPGLLYCIGCYLFLQTKDTQYRLITMPTCVLLALFVNHSFIDNFGETIVETISVVTVVVGTMIFILHPKGLRQCNLSISRMPKLFFYLFYPVHLTIIVGVKYIFLS